MRIFPNALGAVLLALAVAPASAQEAVNFASVGGRVTDASGAVVPDAQVAARQVETNVVGTTTTDRDGRFRFPYLRVGSYQITVHHAGFRDVTRTLTLTVGSAFELPIQLTVGSVDASVTVEASATMLEAARSQIAGTVSQAEVASLPMNGRQFLDLALIVPGVSPTNTGATQLFAETSAVPGQGLSVGSQRNFSNNFIVDGLSANDDAAGLSGMPYTVDAVDQFQVVTSGGQAELGRALGGYINVVTKSGTNALHGTVYEYLRDQRLNAANALSGTRLPMTQHQYGGSVGGPIRRDRTFFFVNAEERRLDQSGLTTIDEGTTAIINQRLDAVGYPGARVATGVYPNPVHTLNFLGKVDHQLNGRDQLAVRHTLYRVRSGHSRNAGGLNAPSASAGLENLDQGVAFSNTLTLSPRTVNETRAQFVYGNLKAPPADPIGPFVTIAGVASFGTLAGAPVQRSNRMYQVVDSISRQAGAHAIRAGADFLYNVDEITFPRSIRGSYTFSSLPNFVGGLYNASGFTQTFGASVVSQSNPNLGVYVQDEWKAGSSLTLNLGLRHDVQWLETIETDADNLSPRVGLVWAPAASRQTVVRANAGLFYDRVPLRAVANALLSAGNTTDVAGLRQISVTLSPAQTGAPLFPAILAAPIPSITLPNLTTMDRQMQNAHSRQGSVEVERQVGPHGTVAVGYQYVRGLNLILAVNQNVPACAAAGTNNGCRPNPGYANNTQYSAAGDSTYHGVYLSLLERPSRWGQYRVSYTLSKSMNNVGENFFSAPIDALNLSKDWGRSDDDQRHRLAISGSLLPAVAAGGGVWDRLRRGLELSGTLQYYSALPLNITSGVSTIQGTPGRPVVDGAFISRNAGIGSDYFAVNLRLSRTFLVYRGLRATALVEGFNITNRRNIVARNPVFGAGHYPDDPLPAFRQPTAAGDPRAFQLAVRLTF
jgi:hypothetical protein